jgi:Mn-dependent DtxR family transcriptional regulator
MRELKFDNDYYKDIFEGIEECNKRAVKMIAKEKGISEDSAHKIIKEIQQC